MTKVNNLPPELLEQSERASAYIREQAEQASRKFDSMAADLSPYATDLSEGES